MAKVHRICSVPDCDKRVAGRGLCDTHYRKDRRAENRAAGVTRRSSRLCTFPDCENPHYAKGYCLAHYTRQYRHGDPSGGGTGLGEPLSWIESRVGYEGDVCLPWPYASGGRGEAVMSYKGRMKPASAVMCLLAHGEAPTPKHECAHNCGNGHLGCMNPNHLRWATRAENMADKHAHGTMIAGEAHHFGRLTESQVRHILSCSERTTDLARQYGVSVSAISAIRCGKNWAWLRINQE